MEVKTQRMIAYGIGLILLIVGVICYAAFPEAVPDEPVRILFTSKAGDVLFDHKIHLDESGYGVECDTCHHEDADDPQSCSECHNEDADLSRGDALHQNCKGCHEDEGAGPVQCAECHVL